MQNRPVSSQLSEPLPPRRAYELAKRGFDVIVASVGVVFLWPVILIIAVAIRVESPGSPFFRQVRIGRFAVPFTMTKFRTMWADNDDSVHREFMERHVRGESEARANDEGNDVFLLDDGRVTRVGKFLRRTSLDELPNLLNVVKGPMSIVGPRPPIPYEVDFYDERAMQRLNVKPGMTGYAQIKGRGSLTFDSMVDYDLEYIAERSLWTDIRVMLATIPAVLFKRGV